MSLTLLIVGAGGHGRVVADTLVAGGFSVSGFLEAATIMHGREIDGIPIVGGDDVLQRHPPGSVLLVNGIGSTSSMNRRREIYDRLRAAGYGFAAVCHPSAVVARSAVVGVGSQIMAGVVLQPGVTIGDNTIINTGALVDHHCSIGSHCHIAPGAVLSGSVTVEDGCHIGTAAVIRQGIHVGACSLIAAGAVVVSDVEPNARIAGVPGRPMVRR